MSKKEIIKQVAMIMTISDYEMYRQEFINSPEYKYLVPPERQSHLADFALQTYVDNYNAVQSSYEEAEDTDLGEDLSNLESL